MHLGGKRLTTKYQASKMFSPPFLVNPELTLDAEFYVPACIWWFS